ncbi:MAG: hypothetical protein JWR11_6250 [Mycobacterium sp.]|nr:hypothetical protein [Mycobacterium sp.]
MIDGRRTLSRTGAAPRIPTPDRTADAAVWSRHDAVSRPSHAAPDLGRVVRLQRPERDSFTTVRHLTRVSTVEARSLPTRPPQSTATDNNEAAATTERERVADLVGFTSPSGNVGCYIDPTAARCDISDRDWTPPPRPADCEFDYGQGINLSAARHRTSSARVTRPSAAAPHWHTANRQRGFNAMRQRRDRSHLHRLDRRTWLLDPAREVSIVLTRNLFLLALGPPRCLQESPSASASMSNHPAISYWPRRCPLRRCCRSAVASASPMATKPVPLKKRHHVRADGHHIECR